MLIAINHLKQSVSARWGKVWGLILFFSNFISLSSQRILQDLPLLDITVGVETWYRLDKTIDCLRGEYYTTKRQIARCKTKWDDDWNGRDGSQKKIDDIVLFSRIKTQNQRCTSLQEAWRLLLLPLKGKFSCGSGIKWRTGSEYIQQPSSSHQRQKDQIQVTPGSQSTVSSCLV